VFLLAGGNGAEVLEFAGESLDEIAVAVQEPAEGGNALAPRLRFDSGPSAARGQVFRAVFYQFASYPAAAK